MRWKECTCLYIACTFEYTIKDTLEFPDRLQDHTLDEDEVLVSYDVSSLFTEVSLEETIDYIIHQIYMQWKQVAASVQRAHL